MPEKKQISNGEAAIFFLRAVAEITFMLDVAEEAYQDTDNPNDMGVTTAYRVSAVVLAVFSFFGMLGNCFIDVGNFKCIGVTANATMFITLSLFAEQTHFDPDRHYALSAACGLYSLYKLAGAAEPGISSPEILQRLLNAAAHVMGGLALALFVHYGEDIEQREHSVLSCVVLSILATIASLMTVAYRFEGEDEAAVPLLAP